MGTFAVEIEVAALDRREYRTVEAMVDTGATYVCLPSSLLRRIGVVPHERRSFVLADGSRIEQDVGRAWVRLDGREEVTLVVFGTEGSAPLLGAVALETFGLAVDPMARRLLPVPGYLLGLKKSGPIPEKRPG